MPVKLWRCAIARLFALGCQTMKAAAIARGVRRAPFNIGRLSGQRVQERRMPADTALSRQPTSRLVNRRHARLPGQKQQNIRTARHP